MANAACYLYLLLVSVSSLRVIVRRNKSDRLSSNGVTAISFLRDMRVQDGSMCLSLVFPSLHRCFLYSWTFQYHNHKRVSQEIVEYRIY